MITVEVMIRLSDTTFTTQVLNPPGTGLAQTNVFLDIAKCFIAPYF